MSVRIKFLGIAAFEILATGDKGLLIDPYLNDNVASPIKVRDSSPVDLILVSHGAFDHIGNTAEIAKRFNSKVICGGDSKLLLLETMGAVRI